MRCEALPLADHQVSFQIDGAERLRWHFGPNYPRPFFYPLVGPAGKSLTRIGHPGAPNHDHHRSIWFSHAQVLGIDFWSEGKPPRIRQKQWMVYRDGEDEALMAVQLGWFDGHDPKELIEQEVIAVIRPGPDRETFVEIQTSLKPTAEMLELGKTNFGLLAVRVAKSISEHFGGGKLTNSEGATGEAAIFGKPARWMDYSGPVTGNTIEGITYFDHPGNVHYPAPWHVREDGWMSASLCMNGPRVLQRSEPLKLRYLLHAHSGPADASRSNELADKFAAAHGYQVVKSTAKHQQFEVRKVSAG